RWVVVAPGLPPVALGPPRSSVRPSAVSAAPRSLVAYQSSSTGKERPESAGMALRSGSSPKGHAWSPITNPRPRLSTTISLGQVPLVSRDHWRAPPSPESPLPSHFVSSLVGPSPGTYADPSQATWEESGDQARSSTSIDRPSGATSGSVTVPS